jgi:hypothetical protein
LLNIPRLLWTNRHVALAAARARGYAIVNDGAYDYGLRTYYVDPAEQVAQLTDAGFTVVTAFGPAGDEIDPLETRERGWISYLVRPIAE